MRRWSLAAWGLVAALSLGACDQPGRYLMESRALTTGPNGPQTPASVGVPFERRWIASGPRRLDSYVVTAPAACADPPVILIYHGVQETISDWVRAQAFLYAHCVSSVVFDYTGSGDSSRPARFKAVNDDAIAAFAAVTRRFPRSRLFVLSHSMGAGPLLQGEPAFASRPHGVIVGQPFSSIRDYAARASPAFGLLARFSPDWWNNVRAVRRLNAPLLLVHSDTDRVNPIAEGREVFAAAPAPKRMALLHGLGHNALYLTPDAGWWTPVLAFVSDRDG